MELNKIRSLSDAELEHHQKTTAEQLFRLRFQVSLGQNDGVRKIRELRREIAQVKTVARERELGIKTEIKERKPKAETAAPAAEARAEETAPAAETKAKKPAKKAVPAAEKKTAKAKGARK